MGAANSIYEVENFLKNMFNDPLILGIKSNFVRKMVANFIVSSKLESSKANYEKIGGKSPLYAHTLNLIKALNALDSSRFYTYAMRYTPPFALDVLRDIKTQGINSLVLFSLYPQYSFSTIRSSLESAKSALAQLDFSPTLYEIPHYHTHKGYIECIVKRVIEALNGENPNEFVLILSAHSLPQARIDEGDPYQRQCEENLSALDSALKAQGIYFKAIDLCYQSRATRMKWLSPDTKAMITKYSSHKMILFPLSFTLDNSETEYELKILYANIAKSLKVPEYRVCRCFNEDLEFANCIIELVNSATNKHKE